MSKKGRQWEKVEVTPSVAAPGDTNPSDATGEKQKSSKLCVSKCVQYCRRDVISGNVQSGWMCLS